MQSSTITVAILAEPKETELRIDERDLHWAMCRGSGAGGQNRHMTDSAVQLTHKPTGLMVRSETERSQQQNKATALALLRARLWQAKDDAAKTERSDLRRAMVGAGQRGDKRRTIRVQDGQVTDHVSGKRWTWKAYERGDWE